MKKLILIILLLIPVQLFAEDFKSSISAYKPTYFLFGNVNDQVLFQLSMKYNLVYPTKYEIYGGYTQRAWWKLYDSSSPFNEFNHEPELFMLFRNKDNFMNMDLGIIDYIQLSPICHKSNGENKDKSRSINTYYGKIQISEGDVINIGVSLKLFGYYYEAIQNEDIHKYTGYYENEVFIKLMSRTVRYLDKEKLYLKHGFNFKSEKGWMEAGLRARLITSKIQPYLLLQVFHGYGESLLNYDKKETNIRIGITFQ